MKILISKLKENASNRPEGYVEDVMSKGVVEGDSLVLTPESYKELLQKYNPNSKALMTEEAKPSCCGGKRLQMPPVGSQVVNLGQAIGVVVKGVVQGQNIKASDDVIAKRKEICDACEFLDKTRNRCSKCGCYYKAKISLSTSHCPLLPPKW